MNSQAKVSKFKKVLCLISISVGIQMLISGCVQAAEFPLPDDNIMSPHTTAEPEWAPNSSTQTPDSSPNHASNPTVETQPAQPEKLGEGNPTVETQKKNLFPLLRPILPPGRNTVDPSYRFGSTQNGEREPHHGVEFLNSFGTPVAAAADGTVVFAGNDSAQIFGPYPNFYGNVVILEHDIPGFPLEPIFTLYAHLSAIHVQEGDNVQAKQIIGEVGLSGIALGSHLHFEVRYGENHYDHVRNPELWLQPFQEENGRPNGAISGSIANGANSPLFVPNITIDPVLESAGEGNSQPTLFLESTYAERLLSGLEPWKENFAIGNLPPGKYQISFVQNGLQKQVVQVESGDIAVVRFVVEGAVP